MQNTTTPNAASNYNAAHKNLLRSNYSEKATEQMFEAEKMLDDEMYSKAKYNGMSEQEKQKAMIDECNEINAENDAYDYYN